MRAAKTLLIGILVFCTLPYLCYAGTVKVIRVSEGDSFTAIEKDIKFKVRLVGIDAPEMSKSQGDPGQPFSHNSKRYLSILVLNKDVFLKRYGVDQDGRVLAVVYVGKKNVNLEMVKAGLAEAFRGKLAPGFDPSLIRTAEAKARRHKHGIWSLGDKYVSPMDWRKRQSK